MMDKALQERMTVFLKPQVSDADLEKIIEKKKASLFGSALRRVAKSDVTVEEVRKRYESYYVIDGRYYIDFYRKAERTIDVDPEVTEVVVGKGVFPVNKDGGVWKKLGSKIREGVGAGKKTVDLRFDEHVVMDRQVHKVLSDGGEEMVEPYKVTASMTENYPGEIQKRDSDNIRKGRLADGEIPSRVFDGLRKSLDEDIRIVTEKMTVNEIRVVYFPVFEARCSGPSKKIGLLRIDGITGKVV